MEKLDQMVKDFHLFEYNKGMETRKWSEDDKRRSKDFITAIEKRLQIRRIYRSLESFVGGRDTYPIILSFTHCGNKSILRVLRIILVILPEHPSETIVFHNEDGNPARANIKQALGYRKDGDRDGKSQFLRCQQPIRHAKSNIEFIGSSIPQPTIITQPESPQVTQRTAKGKRIATNDSEEPTKKLVPASRRVRQDPDEPIRIPYEIHRNIYNLTNDEIQEYLNKEEEIKKKAKEAKLLAMTKLECNRSLPENVPFVNNMVIEEPEYRMFFINVFDVEAFQRMNDMHKVDIETLLSYLVIASNITTPENTQGYA
ncbi:hypothetical protein Tco_0586788 [Tanacetum coccineum]